MTLHVGRKVASVLTHMREENSRKECALATQKKGKCGRLRFLDNLYILVVKNCCVKEAKTVEQAY